MALPMMAWVGITVGTVVLVICVVLACFLYRASKWQAGAEAAAAELRAVPKALDDNSPDVAITIPRLVYPQPVMVPDVLSLSRSANTNHTTEAPSPMAGSGTNVAPTHFTSEDFAHNAPSHMICPISLQVMRNPVSCTCPHTHTFERLFLQIHLRRQATCPMSRTPLLMSEVKPDAELKQQITEYLAEEMQRLCREAGKGGEEEEEEEEGAGDMEVEEEEE